MLYLPKFLKSLNYSIHLLPVNSLLILPMFNLYHPYRFERTCSCTKATAYTPRCIMHRKIIRLFLKEYIMWTCITSNANPVVTSFRMALIKIYCWNWVYNHFPVPFTKGVRRLGPNFLPTTTSTFPRTEDVALPFSGSPCFIDSCS